MRELRTNVRINAPPARVWAILLDTDAHPTWNPFLVRLEGRLVEGDTLRVRLQPPGGKGMSFRPTVTRVTAGRELRWVGHLGIPGLFDGEHIFEIQPDAYGCQFVQRENFSGLLVPLLWPRLSPRVRAGFQAMNAALKSRAETQAVEADGSTPPAPSC